MTPAAFLRAQKMHGAAALLRTTDRTVLDIAGQFGYDNASKFAKGLPKRHRRRAECLSQRRSLRQLRAGGHSFLTGAEKNAAFRRSRAAEFCNLEPHSHNLERMRPLLSLYYGCERNDSFPATRLEQINRVAE